MWSLTPLFRILLFPCRTTQHANSKYIHVLTPAKELKTASQVLIWMSVKNVQQKFLLNQMEFYVLLLIKTVISQWAVKTTFIKIHTVLTKGSIYASIGGPFYGQSSFQIFYRSYLKLACYMPLKFQ